MKKEKSVFKFDFNSFDCFELKIGVILVFINEIINISNE